MELEMKGISKSFGANLVLDNVDFSSHGGCITALLGENGAGKSTLMNILGGVIDFNGGDILLDGEKVVFRSPRESLDAGIAFIHQELNLINDLAVYENLFIGREIRKKGGMLDRNEMMAQAKAVFDEMELDLDPAAMVRDLDASYKQIVEISRAMMMNARLVIMDEPTSSLSRDEAKRLFGIIRELTAQGLAVLYISHFLSEVFEISDYITTMRDGKHVDTVKKEDTTSEAVIRNMVGKDIRDFYAERKADVGEVVLQAKSLTRYGFFKNISFEVHEGEILGICGLSGAGRSELARALVGIDVWDEGELFYQGEKIKNRSYSEAIRRNIAYLSEDRKLQGLMLNLPIGENIVSAKTVSQSKTFWYKEKEETGQVKKLMEELQVNPPNTDKITGQLSGGNQQKVLLAKWLMTNPKLLILDEPTRGVDVGAKSMIHEAVKRHVNKGNAAIIISSDLMEVGGLSDRVLILYHGCQRGIIDKEQDNCSEVSLLMLANGDGAGL